MDGDNKFDCNSTKIRICIKRKMSKITLEKGIEINFNDIHKKKKLF